MAGALRKYTDRNLPSPTGIYCDASFLLDAFYATQPKLLAAHSRPNVANNALGFLTWAQTQRAAFHVSVLALEECASVLVFKPIVEEARRQGVATWKRLRASNKAKFDAMLKDGRQVLALLQAWIASKNIQAFSAVPATSVDDLAMSRMIEVYARALISSHELDAMDAYHFSVARSAGLDWAATGDTDWAVVGRLDLITP